MGPFQTSIITPESLITNAIVAFCRVYRRPSGTRMEIPCAHRPHHTQPIHLFFLSPELRIRVQGYNVMLALVRQVLEQVWLAMGPDSQWHSHRREAV